MKNIIQRTVHFSQTDSTNIRATKAGEQGEPSGTLFTADFQTQGKGRRGRSWSGKRGDAIAMSLLLRPKFPAERASALTILTAMSVTESIRQVLKETCSAAGKPVPVCKIKWPNDVLLQDKKVCGILTEMHTQGDGTYFVVIGIGINVNNESFEPELKDRAVSLKQVTGLTFKRDALIQAFGESLYTYYSAYEKQGDLSAIASAYDDMLVNRGRKVRIEWADEKLTGTALGINKRGELLVKKEDGQVIEVRSGEVSVRGIYGYV